MSFLQDVKGWYRRVRLIARVYLEQRKEMTQIGHGVDISREDKIVASVAQDRFNLVYPAPDTHLLLNSGSIRNVVVSIVSNLAFVASFILFTIFFAEALSAGLMGYCFGGITLAAYLASLATKLTLAGSAFVLGTLLKKADRDLTMNLCLEGAKDDLLRKDDNRRLYHKKALALEMKRITRERDKELSFPLSKLGLLLERANNLGQTISKLQKLDGGDVSKKLATIVALQGERDKILDRCVVLRAQVAEIEERVKASTANLKIAQVAAEALPAAEIIEAMKTGQLDSEIGKIGDEAKEKLELIEGSVRGLQDDLLVDVGIKARSNELHDEKPLLIEE